MKFKLDENIPTDLATYMRKAGHDIADAVEEGLAGKDDTPVLAAATAEDRVLLTFDLDFADVRHYPPGTHAGMSCSVYGTSAGQHLRNRLPAS